MYTVRTFLTSKKGEDLDDCQDSIHPSQTPPEETPGNVFAVSDGATTSFFSRAWSRVLVSHFARNPERAFADWDGWLREAQAEWRAEIEKIVESGQASFYVVNGFRARKPAAATFVGFALGDPTGHGRFWRALVLGDSCLFLLPASGQPTVMNLQTSTEFSSVVQTAESWPKEAPHLPTLHRSAPDRKGSGIVEHDAILIASDALSKWMLLRHEHQRPVWGAVLGLAQDSEFKDLVAMARTEAEDPLENDDVGLVILKFGIPHPAYDGERFDPNPAAKPVVVDRPPQPESKLPEPATRSSLEKVDRTEDVPPPPPPAELPTQRDAQSHRGGVITLAILSLLSLGGAVWLAISLDDSRDLVRDLRSQKIKLSADKNLANGLADKYAAELRVIRTDFDEALRQKDQDLVELHRESREQLTKLQNTQRAEGRRIMELERKNAILREQLDKSTPVAASNDAAGPDPK